MLGIRVKSRKTRREREKDEEDFEHLFKRRREMKDDMMSLSAGVIGSISTTKERNPRKANIHRSSSWWVDGYGGGWDTDMVTDKTDMMFSWRTK